MGSAVFRLGLERIFPVIDSPPGFDHHLTEIQKSRRK
jgi:hypothetical protein